MLTSYEKLMRLLGKSLGLEALQPKGSLQNHKQTSASIQPRVEAQDTDNINSFHSILYAAKISLFIIQSKYRQRFNIIIPQTLHIPLPSFEKQNNIFEKQNNIPHDSRGKSPRPSAAFTPGARSYSPSQKAEQRQHPIIDAVAVLKISYPFDRRWRNAHSASDVL